MVQTDVFVALKAMLVIFLTMIVVFAGMLFVISTHTVRGDISQKPQIELQIDKGIFANLVPYKLLSSNDSATRFRELILVSS